MQCAYQVQVRLFSTVIFYMLVSKAIPNFTQH
jgi:hypothetical protein